MAISYQIVVERHQGHLKCISTPGQGTCFLIEVPEAFQPQITLRTEPLNDRVGDLNSFYGQWDWHS
jgi:hypothetical protein